MSRGSRRERAKYGLRSFGHIWLYPDGSVYEFQLSEVLFYECSIPIAAFFEGSRELRAKRIYYLRRPEFPAYAVDAEFRLEWDFAALFFRFKAYIYALFETGSQELIAQREIRVETILHIRK
jgi:hypothetical protein